jgi:glycogen operon protein
MTLPKIIALWLVAFASLVVAGAPAAADVDSQHLGAKHDATQSNITFRVHSSRATRIELDLYGVAFGAPEVAKYVLTEDADDVWSVAVPVADLQAAGVSGAVFYGYRAWGPNWPFDPSWTKGSAVGFVADVDAAGNRFNPNNLLFDPYAMELSHDPLNPNNSDARVFASGPNYRVADSGLKAPKGIVLPVDTSSTGTKPVRAQKDDINYEVRVRGLTENDPDIPVAFCGTYRGAALKAGDLAGLGVTAVEFLPVQETQNDANDVTPDSTAGVNYWGYETLD